MMAKWRTQSYVTFWVGVLALCVASAAPLVSSAQTSAVIVAQNPGVTPRRDVVMVGGVGTSWSGG